MPDANSTRTRAPNKQLPPVEYLNECFRYYPATGRLQWKERPRAHFNDERYWTRWSRTFAWTTAGTVIPEGYRVLTINCHQYYAHRIVWKIMTGQDPANTVDHIDTDPSNNAWSNLRLATHTGQRNNSRLRKNASGYRGVSQSSNGRWVAKIKTDYVMHHINTFNTPEEASAAYEAAARKLHGEFYRSPSKHRK